eukprot:9466825-Pyramimonas_sp.AAC.1
MSSQPQGTGRDFWDSTFLTIIASGVGAPRATRPIFRKRCRSGCSSWRAFAAAPGPSEAWPETAPGE